MFDSVGRFVRAIGRDGEGPGEYRWAGQLLSLPGDSLLVIDPDLGRLSLLTPDQKVSRTFPMPPGRFSWDAVVRDDGGLVLNMFRGTPAAAGFPLHLIDNQGRAVLSFGSEDNEEAVRSDLRATTFRKLARAKGHGIWSAKVNEYRINLWDSKGSKARELIGRRPWFRPWLVDADLAPESAPQSKIVAIHEDKQGLLWVMFNVPDPRWRQGLEVMQTPEGRYYVPIENDLVFDTIIEVLDRRGSLLAAQRLPVALVDFVDDGVAFSIRDRSDGLTQVVIWNLVLLQPH